MALIPANKAVLAALCRPLYLHDHGTFPSASDRIPIVMGIRLIPRLDIKGPNLVKGIHLEGLRVLGRPEAFAHFYADTGADELIYQDVVASLYGRNSLLDLVSRTATEIFIPLTVGGGIRTLDDIKEALRAGADKVAINTAVVNDPDLVVSASRRFGSSTIVVAIEAIQQPDGTFHVYTDSGREATGLDAIEWAERVAAMGAGELLVTSVDRDGTGKGFDIVLTRQIADAVSIPVIASGGAGHPQHLVDVVFEGHADAVSVASVAHYHAVSLLEAHIDSSDGNTTFLTSGRRAAHVDATGIAELKKHMADSGLDCRPVPATTVAP